MKQHQVPALTTEAPSKKRLTAKKVFSTLVTTLALTGVMLLFNSASPRSSLESRRTHNAGQPLIHEESFGLSRQRSDFDKAITLLAEGADADPRLARYYQRVARRVRWTDTGAKNHSSVVEPVRNSKPKTNDGVAGATAYAVAAPMNKPDSAPHDSSSSDEPSESGYASRQRYAVGDMAFDTNAAIVRWMNHYTATPGGRRTMTIGIDRSDSYLEMARAEFRSAGVPEDLVWLAFVESVWNPSAVSPAAAGGIWQFIPSTATDYGLTVQAGNDERTDPLKQTRVAAAYLRDLYTIFGDWTLAMAAYNSGEPRVMAAIVKNGRPDFWDLCDKQLLPKETRDYVPKILAVIKVASQAEAFGLTPESEPGLSAGS